ncbi:hypothetical protein ZYGR_0W00350 [Zygosaccharomyces rouxii]|uniref:ZYRO0F16984p n=2 Tax=Zygosaccharomyces rouxii TaxID=4956 RepID=C5DYZ6_ZYGRC|nr:uncharacterized protein ZYRO0F16984g [Zygosaccharomyces rouxii]KAH9201281.1 inositol phosphosphingolipids phospholipase C [Zygosaccharomyces rouxii]GAV50509.1 hypothetical protein ZYGR_0W00350 [Zygosaccharomyces rouxii]CAQ43367.1 Inositol phosphosphingolipids phospholipase C [Zygosaccharomyces rouxii]CAR29007.1 ZYRO0F16984p [Zygosaccharomyces rouxii]
MPVSGGSDHGSSSTASKPVQDLPSFKLLTFNTWGLKWLSTNRKERLRAIGDELSGRFTSVPIPGSDNIELGKRHSQFEQYDVVALQEVWCQEDWDYIVMRCSENYPYHRIFYSGIITGPGLAILSRIPIESTFLYRFPLNGRPTAVHRGDWYVGKSVAITLLQQIDNNTPPLAIMNSHMHAPYALQGDAAYACHRACQAWDFAKLANLYKKAGYAVIVTGDLNSRPGSLHHRLLTDETDLVDSWEQLYGQQDPETLAKLKPSEQIIYGCTTCDSNLNTYRLDKRLDEACRLDYALVDPDRLLPTAAGARFTERIPGVGSFSDHFAYTCTLKLLPRASSDIPLPMTASQTREKLIQRYANYQEMLQCLAQYVVNAKRQKLLRYTHLGLSIIVLIFSCFLAFMTDWAAIFWVLFIAVVCITGLLDGLLAFMFGEKELRELREVEQEVIGAQQYLQSQLDFRNKL